MSATIDPTSVGTHPFDADTAVEPRGDGRYRADVRSSWWVGRGPNGGYVAALLLRALMAELADAARAPRSLTVHFTAPPAEGPLEIAVTVERTGRSLSTVSARAEQHGRLVALALAAFSPAWPGFDYDDTTAPEAPSAAASVPVDPARPGAPALLANYDTRWAFGTPPGTGATGPAHVGAWMRCAAPRVHDALVVSAYADALIPAPFARLGRLAPAPTVDLTVHFASELPGLLAPAPEAHCLVTGRADLSREGFFVGDADVWSPDGRLLARSRQHALLIHRGA
jgi:acyl-CoA thioesterase